MAHKNLTCNSSGMMTRNAYRLMTTAILLVMAHVAAAQEENLETIADGHHLAAYLVAGLMIGLVTMIFSNRVFYYREKEVTKEAREVIAQLGLVLNANKTQVWTLDVMKRMYTVFSNEGETLKDFMPMDFAQHYDMDDYRELRRLITALREGRQEEGTVTMRGRGEDEGRTYDVNLSVLKRNKRGAVKQLIGIQHDTTEEKAQRENWRRLAMRYQTVFNSSLVDMIFYDKEGRLTDINDKALETFGVTDRQALMERGVRITDVPSYRDLDIEGLESMSISSITDIDETKLRDERIPEMKAGGKMYYEVNVSAVRDEEGQLQGVIAAGLNITDMVKEHHRQQRNAQLLKVRNKDIEEYIRNINYTLRVNGVRMLYYLPERHELEVWSDLERADYRLTQIRCISLIDEVDRERTRGLMRRMDRRTEGSLTVTLKTVLKDTEGRGIYMTFNVVPVKDKEGKTMHYFGMMRDDTEMHYTEARLREETEKAQETEGLKDTFLQNMSYEIRTPLNAVIGFAELYNAPHEAEDEAIFAEEIKRNTGDLLALVNDILFMSRLDAKMVEINYRETDFATIFDGYCYMGWSRLAPGVSVSVENPYSRLMVTIDDEHVGEVIQKLCAHAAQQTTEGEIKAKYDYRHGELNITIEDSGAGYSEERLAHVFDRFWRENSDTAAYGTGLEMAIIKELVVQMGGSIEIQSQAGKGSTVYIIIPCQMSAMEKGGKDD